MRSTLIIISLFFLIAGCSPKFNNIKWEPNKDLAHLLAKEAATLSSEEGIWGIVIIDTGHNDTLMFMNADLAFIPASLTKLFVSAASYNLLPKIDFASMHISSPIYADSSVDTLYWQGAGLFLADIYGYPDSVFENNLMRLEKIGIRRVNKSLALFNPVEGESLYPGWTMEDLSSYFAAKPSFSNFKNNLWRIHLTRQSFDSVTVVIEPESKFVPEVKIKTGDHFFYRWDFHRGGIPYLNVGLLPEDSLRTLFIPMLQPEAVWAEKMKESLIKSNIMSEQTPIVFYRKQRDLGPAVTAYRTIGLDSLLIQANRYSNNLVAEELLRSLGFFNSGVYGRESGLVVIDSLMKENGLIRGIDYRFWDGSGMSRYNWVKPEAVGKLLMEKYENPALLATLARAEQPGTLQKRIGGFPSDVNVSGKTGSLRGIRNFAGFVDAPANKRYLVVLMVNQFTLTSREIDKVMQKFLLILTLEGDLEGL